MESGAIRRKGLSQDFMCQPRVPPRNPPCSFFFYKCIPQGAIDFAERNSGVRGAECRTFFGVAGFAPEL